MGVGKIGGVGTTGSPSLTEETSPPSPVAPKPAPARGIQNSFTTEQQTNLPSPPAAVMPADSGPVITAGALQRGVIPPETNGEVGPALSFDEDLRLTRTQAAVVDSDINWRSVRAGTTLEDLALRFDTSIAKLRELNPDLPLEKGLLREDILLAVPSGDLPRGFKPHRTTVRESGPNAYKTPAPELNDVLKGDAIMYRGMGGASVKELQRKLNALGANPPLAVDGKFGPRTEAALKALQKANGIQQTGVLGAASLKAMMVEGCKHIPPDAVDVPVRSAYELSLLADGNVGDALARVSEAGAQAMNSRGKCALGVNNALVALGLENDRGHAYQKANQLECNSKFQEVSVSADELSQLPPGAVVVWGRSRAKPYGHVSIALGDGREASDHVQKQMEGGKYGTDFGNGPDPYGRQFRVFMPRESASA